MIQSNERAPINIDSAAFHAASAGIAINAAVVDGDFWVGAYKNPAAVCIARIVVKGAAINYCRTIRAKTGTAAALPPIVEKQTLIDGQVAPGAINASAWSLDAREPSAAVSYSDLVEGQVYSAASTGGKVNRGAWMRVEIIDSHLGQGQIVDGNGVAAYCEVKTWVAVVAVDAVVIAVEDDAGGDVGQLGGEGDISRDVDDVGFAVAVGGIDGADQAGVTIRSEGSGLDRCRRKQQEDQRDEDEFEAKKRG